MNFINKVVCITAFFAIGSVSALVRPRTKAPVAPAKSAPQPGGGPSAPTKPAIQGQTYKQLHDNILRMSQANVFSGNNLKDTFINDTVAKAQAADIDADGIKFLLQTARDKFAPFTGNDADDLGILININKQIDAAV